MTHNPANLSTEPAKKRVLLVDDHPLMRDSLVRLIDGEPGLECCGAAATAEEVISLLNASRPDLIITDLTLPGRSGLDLIKDVKAIAPEMQVLVFTMHNEMLYAERALRSGARGYLMKEAGSEKLLQAVHQVLGGEVAVSPKLSAKILDMFSAKRPRGSDSPVEKLSDREFEVFQLIGYGRTTKEIAQQLHLSEKTVAVHRGHIKEKLGIAHINDLIRHAARWVETEGAPGSGTDAL